MEEFRGASRVAELEPGEPEVPHDDAFQRTTSTAQGSQGMLQQRLRLHQVAALVFQLGQAALGDYGRVYDQPGR